MPYTLAHPAAVLPIWRRAARWSSFSGLVIGSVSPDLLYFRGDHAGGMSAHSPAGLLGRALPLGLALFVLFHVALKRPALLLFPPSHRPALASVCGPLRFPRPVPLLVVLASLLLGAVTHVLWDSLTHDEMAPAFLPFLKMPLYRSALGTLSIARMLQVAFSIVGLAWLWVAYARWRLRLPSGLPAPEAPAFTERVRLPFLVLAAVASPIVGRLWVTWTKPFSYHLVLWMLGTTSTAFLAVCLWAAFVWTGLFVRWTTRALRRAPRSPAAVPPPSDPLRYSSKGPLP